MDWSAVRNIFFFYVVEFIIYGTIMVGQNFLRGKVKCTYCYVYSGTIRSVVGNHLERCEKLGRPNFIFLLTVENANLRRPCVMFLFFISYCFISV